MVKENLDISRQYLNSVHSKRDISCIVDRKIKRKQYDLAVIIPCYNVEKYVEKAIDSVLNYQGKYSLEVIIVDDGSEDLTGVIVDNYGELDNVIVVHQENGGLSAARNTGLLYVDARYLFFLDSDDYLIEDSLEKMLNVAFENDADIVEGLMQTFSDKDEDFTCKPLSGICERCEGYKLSGYACGKIFKVNLFDDISFPEGYLYEDGVITYLVIPRTKNTFTLDMIVYAYRQNQRGISKSFQKDTRSIDAYWLREVLFADMKRLGIEINQRLYEQILEEIALTFVRTNEMETNIKVSIFFLTTEWFKDLHKRYSTTNKFQAVLEKGLELENYQTYSDGCAVLWNRKLTEGG